MIKLSKFEKPTILKEKESEWAAEYQRFINGDENVPKVAKFRYRHPDIKAALREEAFDKCIYCESKISHVFPGETDHILPISKRPDKAVEWENLAYVCTECNREKSNYYDENEPLINPYTDDPSVHLKFYGPLILQQTNDPKGYLTTKIMKLSRASLFERRKEKIEKIQLMLDHWKSLPDGQVKNILKNEILIEADKDKEYSAITSNFLKAAVRW